MALQEVKELMDSLAPMWYWVPVKVRFQGRWKLHPYTLRFAAGSAAEALEKMIDWLEGQPKENIDFFEDDYHPKGPCESEEAALKEAEGYRRKYAANQMKLMSEG